MILVVDDHADTVGFLCRLLTRRGYDTQCAYDGFGAMQILKSETPRLVVLDVQMPHMTGLEVLQAMREDERLQRIPVIVYSAGHEKAQYDQAIKLGAKAFAVKGAVDVREVIALVERFATPAATP